MRPKCLLLIAKQKDDATTSIHAGKTQDQRKHGSGDEADLGAQRHKKGPKEATILTTIETIDPSKGKTRLQFCQHERTNMKHSFLVYFFRQSKENLDILYFAFYYNGFLL